MDSPPFGDDTFIDMLVEVESPLTGLLVSLNSQDVTNSIEQTAMEIIAKANILRIFPSII